MKNIAAELADMASDETIEYRPAGGATYRDARGRVWHRMMANYVGKSSGWLYWLRRGAEPLGYAGAFDDGSCDSPSL